MGSVIGRAETRMKKSIQESANKSCEEYRRIETEDRIRVDQIMLNVLLDSAPGSSR